MNDADVKRIIDEALLARDNAYSPYSRFRVGACLLTAGGRTYRGANVENSSFPAGICAERSALAAAASAGERDFVAIAVASDSDTPTFPCGICRQALVEFAPDMIVYAANNKGEYEAYRLDSLLPKAFTMKK